MSKLREIKEELVQDITSKIKKSKSTFIVEYLGLTVAEMTKLRNELRAEGVELKVYKNRLFKIAAKNAGFEELGETLFGPNAIAFSSEDEISGARIIAEHAKKRDFLKFKAGIFEGKVVDFQMVTILSQIPSRETLLTQISAGLMQPLRQIAIGLNMLEESHVAGVDKILTPATEEIKKEVKEEVVSAPEALQTEEKTEEIISTPEVVVESEKQKEKVTSVPETEVAK